LDFVSCEVAPASLPGNCLGYGGLDMPRMSNRLLSLRWDRHFDAMPVASGFVAFY
jgi:hypothetical protein